MRPLSAIPLFPPSAPGEVALRSVAARWMPRQGQPMLIEHRIGGAGMTGAAAAREAATDGTTLLFASGDALLNNTALFSQLSQDPVRDFRPLTQTGTVPRVLVAPGCTAQCHL